MKSKIKDVWFNSVIADGHFVEIDFISDEEAEKAVEKIKAWQRLENKGLQICWWCDSDEVDLNGCGHNNDNFIVGMWLNTLTDDTISDLNLLFGGDK